MTLSLKYLLTHRLEESFDKIPDTDLTNLWIVVEECKRHVISYSMRRCGGNQVQAARALGIDRITLRRYLRQYVSEAAK